MSIHQQSQLGPENNQIQQSKRPWLAPELDKISVLETASGPLGVSLESGACSDPLTS